MKLVGAKHLIEVGLFSFFVFWIVNLIPCVLSGASLDAKLEYFRGDILDNYKRVLSRRLMRFSEWIGDAGGASPISFSAQSYLFCLGIGALYPILMFAVSWGFGASGIIGEIEILPDNVALGRRVEGSQNIEWFTRDLSSSERLSILAALVLPPAILFFAKLPGHGVVRNLIGFLIIVIAVTIFSWATFIVVTVSR